MEATLDKLCACAAEHFNCPKESLDPKKDFFQMLGINSFQALELLSKLENEFNVEIPDYEVQDVKTFEALAEIIDERL